LFFLIATNGYVYEECDFLEHYFIHNVEPNLKVAKSSDW
jgi:hypothetical protein